MRENELLGIEEGNKRRRDRRKQKTRRKEEARKKRREQGRKRSREGERTEPEESSECEGERNRISQQAPKTQMKRCKRGASRRGIEGREKMKDGKKGREPWTQPNARPPRQPVTQPSSQPTSQPDVHRDKLKRQGRGHSREKERTIRECVQRKKGT